MADEMIPMEVDQENQLAIVIVDQPAETAEPRFYEGTMFGLPREWTAEIRPRKTSSKYRGKVDQFFYEPGTRRQFRSLKAVKKHLGLDVGQTSRKRKPNPSKAAGQTESLNEKEKSASKAAGQFKDKVGASNKIAEEHKEEEHHHYFDKVANKIRWQLVNSEQNRWNKYVKVPNAVQERWMGIFLKPQSYRKANHQG